MQVAKHFWLLCLTLYALLCGCSRERADYELKVTSILPPDHPTSLALQFFKEEIERQSQGEMSVRLFTGGQLGNANDSLELARGGNIEIVQCSAIHIAPFSPLFNTLGLPFLFRDRVHRFEALDGPMAEPLHRKLEAIDLRLLAVFDAGSRNLMTKEGPVTKPDDLNGMKIRVMPSQTMVDSINALGTTAVAMNQGDVYTALQTGVLDGWENNPPTALNFRMYETGCTYYAWSRHLAIPDFLVMSEITYKKLPEHLQSIVDKVALETQTKQRELWLTAEIDAVEKLSDNGMQFNEVDQAAFTSCVDTLYQESYHKFGPEFKAYAESLKTLP